MFGDLPKAGRATLNCKAVAATADRTGGGCLTHVVQGHQEHGEEYQQSSHHTNQTDYG